MIGIALLGGFILNFMPCVLPVLSLKLLGVVGAGGQARRHICGSDCWPRRRASSRRSWCWRAPTIGVRAAGFAVGWGIQFQQPLFLIFMMALVTLFAANLWGLFEVPLPSAVAEWSGADRGHGMLGNFAAGAFATLLATPCSAPFVGTAIGFALAAGSGVIAGDLSGDGHRPGLALSRHCRSAAPGGMAAPAGPVDDRVAPRARRRAGG